MEGIHKVLAGLVEVATTIGYTRYVRHNQSVRPVEITVLGAVVHRILHCPDALYAVLVLRFWTEIVVKIRLQIKSSGSIDRRIGELDYFLQVLGIDLRYGMAVGFVLTISLIQIDLGEQCCSGSSGRTALVSLLLGALLKLWV